MGVSTAALRWDISDSTTAAVLPVPPTHCTSVPHLPRMDILVDHA